MKCKKFCRAVLITLTFILGGLCIVGVGLLGEKWQHERAAEAQTK